MDDTQSGEAILEHVLSTWRRAVDDRDFGTIRSLFAADCLFQGSRREPSRGRDRVVEYYESQVTGLTVDYRVLDVRRPAENVIVGFAEADFRRPQGVNHRHLSIVLERDGSDWLIGQYHVSLIPEKD